tara:strand:+ start:14942 stop:15415 length:474 start_codon:yes stop_codon:yes gene_type:complete
MSDSSSGAVSGGDLKLAATDPEDIAVLSALLQDAVIPISEMVYLAAESRFALVANRFRWEDAPAEKVAGRIYERVRCGVTFDRVTGVRRRNFDHAQRGQVFDLLALEATNAYVDLVFAGGATVRLEVERILCHAEDFGEPWPTRWRPEHDLGDGEET